MTLEEIANGAAPVIRTGIGGIPQLAREVQERLGRCGLLDPPADGLFGPVSQWALEVFMKRCQVDLTQLDARAARALLEQANETGAFPMQQPSGNTFVDRIIRRLIQLDHWICRSPDCVNVIYVEGIDPGGTLNDNAPNSFNDLRLLLRINRNGRPVLEGEWEATTEPGYYHTVIKRLDPGGAARISLGQHKAWCLGRHPRKGKTSHAALVQTAPVTVYRDLNEDFRRVGDATQTGVFGINQHWGYDMDRTNIGNASAGCLVGRTKAGHRDFIGLLNSDARYRANNGYRFMTSVIEGAALL